MKTHPAYLFIGPATELIQRASTFIKEHQCKKKGCNACITCRQIENKAHHLLLWLTPENMYTLAHIEMVMDRIRFALNEGEHFFIVFEQAELFNSACANSLLKSLEEPPPGYHFILLAQRSQGILATIRSRCIVQQLSSILDEQHSPLMEYFTQMHLSKTSELVRELEKQRIQEKEIAPFLDQLSAYWYNQLAVISEKNEMNERLYRLLALIQEAQKKPVMSGSSKLFLKNLYLQLLLAF